MRQEGQNLSAKKGRLASNRLNGSASQQNDAKSTSTTSRSKHAHRGEIEPKLMA